MDWGQAVEYAVMGLGGLAGLGWSVDLLKARAVNRKTHAEGTVMLVESADAYAQSLLLRVAKLEEEADADRVARYRQDALLREHGRWDDHVRHSLERLTGEPVAAPPPLFDDPAA